MNYKQIEEGIRVYKIEQEARAFSLIREKKFNYKPCVYQNLNNEWVVLY